jgi:hypothetical protein
VTHEYPTRKILIIGACQLALEAFHDTDSLLEVKRLKAALLMGAEATTSNIAIKDRLAYAQQTLRVSHEEWENVVKVRYVEYKS